MVCPSSLSRYLKRPRVTARTRGWVDLKAVLSGSAVIFLDACPLFLTVKVKSKVKKGIAVCRQACHHRYGNSHAIWDHTLPPGRGDIPAFIPAKALLSLCSASSTFFVLTGPAQTAQQSISVALISF